MKWQLIHGIVLFSIFSCKTSNKFNQLDNDSKVKGGDAPEIKGNCDPYLVDPYNKRITISWKQERIYFGKNRYFTICYQNEKELALKETINYAVRWVEGFFNFSFMYQSWSEKVYIIASVDQYNALFTNVFGMERPSYAIGTGYTAMGEGGITLLSPLRWKDDEVKGNHCLDEPTGEDCLKSEEVRQTIVHELTHHFHNEQFYIVKGNSDKNNLSNEEIKWYWEGIAYVVAKQAEYANLDQFTNHMKVSFGIDDISKYINKIGSLKNVWQWNAMAHPSYQLSAYLVKYLKYLESKKGNRNINQLYRTLMFQDSNEKILAELGISEKELLKGWNNWLQNNFPPPQ